MESSKVKSLEDLCYKDTEGEEGEERERAEVVGSPHGGRRAVHIRDIGGDHSQTAREGDRATDVAEIFNVPICGYIEFHNSVCPPTWT